jgi:hypothetical protein
VRRALCLIAFVLVVVLPLVLIGGVLAIAGDDLAPSAKAQRDIPWDLMPLYMAAAATCEGLDWTVLAAIHKVETGFGRGSATSSAGAQGPMQFMPPTWDAYAVDGDGDGYAAVDDVEDAVFSAAALLCANGGGDPARLADAIWNYNHSDSYVAEVLRLAASYGVVTLDGTTVRATPVDVLRNPRILLTANARADVEAGVVDARLLGLLQTLSRRYSVGVSVFKTGHSMRTRSGSISNHYYGRGVDIFFVSGAPVSSSNTAARDVVRMLAGLPEGSSPDEIGHPFAEVHVRGGFTDADHRDHLHVGFDG